MLPCVRVFFHVRITLFPLNLRLPGTVPSTFAVPLACIFTVTLPSSPSSLPYPVGDFVSIIVYVPSASPSNAAIPFAPVVSLIPPGNSINSAPASGLPSSSSFIMVMLPAVYFSLVMVIVPWAAVFFIVIPSEGLLSSIYPCGAAISLT